MIFECYEVRLWDVGCLTLLSGYSVRLQGFRSVLGSLCFCDFHDFRDFSFAGWFGKFFLGLVGK
jgi:hypothetical protein